eukprot:488270-Prorocentrum_minimum.AAC.1
MASFVEWFANELVEEEAVVPDVINANKSLFVFGLVLTGMSAPPMDMTECVPSRTCPRRR